MSGAARLRELLRSKRMVVAPGAYDALTAKLVEGAGFEAVYMTGYGTAAALRGLPDIGLLTMTEMLENARAIAGAVEIPVIADADTGYGNPLNVMRTVREYEAAGVAALHIEDQVWPKRCGHMTGKQVVPAADMVGKIRAAVDARRTPELVIIARTDALAVEGWERTMERAHAYAEAGADVLFIEAPETEREVEAIPGQFTTPCLINMAPRTPALPPARLEAAGYAIAIYPGLCLAATIQANLEALRAFKGEGRPPAAERGLAAFAEFNQFLGVPNYFALAERYGQPSGGQGT